MSNCNKLNDQMSKFKIGDKVRCIKEVTKKKPIGVGEIIESRGNFYKVFFKDWVLTIGPPGAHWWCGNDHLELVEEELKTGELRKGTFAWAVEQMKQGKKVRRYTWEKEYFIEFRGGSKHIDFDNVGTPHLRLIEYEATDWEIYEEENSGELLKRLGIDGTLWAKEFMKLFGADEKTQIDEGIMIAWFCNSIMAGYDEASRRARELNK